MTGLALSTVSGARRPPLTDAAIALLLAAAAQVELWVGGLPGPTGANLLAASVTTLPLAWRSRAPLAVTLVTTTGFGLSIALGVSQSEPLVAALAPIVALYTLGARGSLRAGAIGFGAACSAYVAAALVDGSGDALRSLWVTLPANLIALAVGAAVRELGFETDMLEARATQLERERDARAEEAIWEERARIARELHDVIGHSVSVMGIQAGAVRRRLTPEQTEEREALVAVERVGRETVDEMRRLLGILRPDEHEALVSVPTLQRFHDLVADMRRSGLRVDFVADGDIDGLTPGRALAAFRIAQEALTNVLKHAPDADVRLTLRRSPAAVAVEVVDDGGSLDGASKEDGDGHGLLGMRERVSLYGGTLEAGPRRDGGFEVSARIPLGDS